MDKKEQVITQIRAAWKNIPYPGDDRIFTDNSYDDEDIVDYFKGTTWEGHTPENLRKHSSAFTFLSPVAYNYWLAAFLLAAIEDPREADVCVEYIAWSICPYKTPDTDYEARMALFTQEQMDALAGYFQYQIEHLSSMGYDVDDEIRSREHIKTLLGR
jgi:hypothetical protein